MKKYVKFSRVDEKGFFKVEEFKVDSRDFFTKSLNLAKVSLRAHKKLKIVGTTLNVNEATRVAETLRRLGYIEFDDVQTETNVVNGTRQVRLVITVHITDDFERLFKENEEERKKKEEERKKRNEEKNKAK